MSNPGELKQSGKIIAEKFLVVKTFMKASKAIMTLSNLPAELRRADRGCCRVVHQHS